MPKTGTRECKHAKLPKPKTEFMEAACPDCEAHVLSLDATETAPKPTLQWTVVIACKLCSTPTKPRYHTPPDCEVSKNPKKPVKAVKPVKPAPVVEPAVVEIPIEIEEELVLDDLPIM